MANIVTKETSPKKIISNNKIINFKPHQWTNNNNNKVCTSWKTIIIYFKINKLWTTCILTINIMNSHLRAMPTGNNNLPKRNSTRASSPTPTNFWTHKTPKIFWASNLETKITMGEVQNKITLSWNNPNRSLIPNTGT